MITMGQVASYTLVSRQHPAMLNTTICKLAFRRFKISPIHHYWFYFKKDSLKVSQSEGQRRRVDCHYFVGFLTTKWVITLDVGGQGRAGQGVQTPSIRRGGGEKSLEADFRHLVIIRPRSVSGPANIVRIQQNMSV